MVPLGSIPYDDFPTLVGRKVWSKKTGNYGTVTSCVDSRNGWDIWFEFKTLKGIKKSGFWAISFINRFKQEPESCVVYLLDKEKVLDT